MHALIGKDACVTDSVARNRALYLFICLKRDPDQLFVKFVIFKSYRLYAFLKTRQEFVPIINK